MRYFFDTEFMEDGKTIELLSIGIVAEDGREYYAEDAEADWSHASFWVQQNVLRHLDLSKHGKPRDTMAFEILQFVQEGGPRPEFWAYFCSYDWVVLCQLYGTMLDLPPGWPMLCMDVKAFAILLGNPPLPIQQETHHHALADARWTKHAWETLANRVPR